MLEFIAANTNIFILVLVLLLTLHSTLFYLILRRQIYTKMRIMSYLDDYERRFRDLSTRIKNIEQQNMDDQR